MLKIRQAWVGCRKVLKEQHSIAPDVSCWFFQTLLPSWTQLFMREADAFVLYQWTPVPSSFWLGLASGEPQQETPEERGCIPLVHSLQGCPRLAAYLSRSLDLSRMLLTQRSSSWLSVPLYPLIHPRQGLWQLHCLDPHSLSISCGFLTFFPNLCN